MMFNLNETGNKFRIIPVIYDKASNRKDEINPPALKHNEILCEDQTQLILDKPVVRSIFDKFLRNGQKIRVIGGVVFATLFRVSNADYETQSVKPVDLDFDVEDLSAVGMIPGSNAKGIVTVNEGDIDADIAELPKGQEFARKGLLELNKIYLFAKEKLPIGVQESAEWKSIQTSIEGCQKLDISDYEKYRILVSNFMHQSIYIEVNRTQDGKDIATLKDPLNYLEDDEYKVKDILAKIKKGEIKSLVNLPLKANELSFYTPYLSILEKILDNGVSLNDIPVDRGILKESLQRLHHFIKYASQNEIYLSYTENFWTTYKNLAMLLTEHETMDEQTREWFADKNREAFAGAVADNPVRAYSYMIENLPFAEDLLGKYGEIFKPLVHQDKKDPNYQLANDLAIRIRKGLVYFYGMDQENLLIDEVNSIKNLVMEHEPEGVNEFFSLLGIVLWHKGIVTDMEEYVDEIAKKWSNQARLSSTKMWNSNNKFSPVVDRETILASMDMMLSPDYSEYLRKFVLSGEPFTQVPEKQEVSNL